MSLLSALQTKKLGLFELIAIGFDLYLKYFRTFFSLFCMELPFSIISIILALDSSSNLILSIPKSLFLVFYAFVVIPAYTIAFAILAEGYILGENPHLNDLRDFQRINYSKKNKRQHLCKNDNHYEGGERVCRRQTLSPPSISHKEFIHLSFREGVKCKMVMI